MNSILESVNYMASAITMLQKNTIPTYRPVSQVQSNLIHRSIQEHCIAVGLQVVVIMEVNFHMEESRGPRGRGEHFMSSSNTFISITTMTSNMGNTSNMVREYSYRKYKNLSNIQSTAGVSRLNHSMAVINISTPDNSSSFQNETSPLQFRANG